MGKRIPELDQPTTGVRTGKYAKYNPVSDKTEQIDLMTDLGAVRASFDWQADTTYALNDIVLFRGLTAWKSLQASNTGNVPSENSYWTASPISIADGITLTPHANGLFTYNKSLIIHNYAIYQLTNLAPFESSDIAAEITSGEWTYVGVLGQVDYLDFSEQATPPTYSEARFYYDDIKKNFVFYNDRTSVRMDLGRELWLRSINKTGSGTTNGRAVYVSGASGDLPEVQLAQADALSTSMIIAVYTEDVAIDDNGEATTQGLVNDIDTSSWSAGTLLYLSETTAGGFTDVAPLPPNIVIPIGYVLKSDATTGIIYVNIGAPEQSITRVIGSSWSAYSGSLASTNWLKGFYTFNSSTTPAGGTNIGSSNSAHGSHVYVVLGAASTDMVIRFTGTSITDEGVRTASDTQDIDTSGGVLNDYFETSKKWIGVVSMTLLSGTGIVVNYGLAAYWDNRNTRFIVSSFEWVGRAGANDSSPNIRLFHHKATGWTYGAGGATPPSAIVDMQAVYNTEYQFVNDRYFKFKRIGLSQVIQGDGSEGILVGIDISANNAVANSNVEIQIIGT